jgi:hypothetical protein
MAVRSFDREEQSHVENPLEQNKALVLEAFDTLFNKRDYEAASRFWSDKYIQHSAHIEPGREGLFRLIRLPESLRYEHGLILAEGDYVIVHSRFSGHGRPAAWGRRRYSADRERRSGRALGRTPGRGDPSRIEERIAYVRRPLSRMTGFSREDSFIVAKLCAWSTAMQSSVLRKTQKCSALVSPGRSWSAMSDVRVRGKSGH